MKAQDLKNSILQMAMEGKLVPQDSNDEPASVLLERIKQEKEQLINEKKIKRNNKESVIFRKNNHFYEKVGKNGEEVCIDDEIPWDIPDTWEWVRFGAVVNFSLGKTPQRKNPEFWENGTIPWVSIADMKDGEVIFSTKEKVNTYALEQSFKNNLVSKDTLLMSFKLTVGKVSILGMDAVHNEAIISINPFFDEKCAFRDYLFWILPIVSQFGDTKSAIKGKTLNSKSLNNLLLPMPNLNEQKRIVMKLNELNPFIDQYGIFKEELDSLNIGFPTKIKDSILQDAVQGKLVSQDPNEEPASVLLERIKEEKEQLIKEKKIKRDKNESFIFRKNNHFYEKLGKNGDEICIDEELPFQIPDTWEWCTLSNILSVKGGKRVPKGYKLLDTPTPYIYIRVTNMKNGTITQDDLKYIDEEVHSQIKNYTISKDDLYITVAGTIGQVGIVPDFFDGMNLTENANKLTNISINKEFLRLILMSDFVQNQLSKRTTKVAQPKLAIKRVLSTKIPLPPLNEQKRIVEKVNKLFILNEYGY